MIKENQKILNAMFAVLDACFCLLSMLLAFALRFIDYDGMYLGINYYIRLMFFIIPVYFLIYNYFGLHDSFRSKALIHEIGRIIQSNLIGILLIFVLMFLLKELQASRFVVLLFGILNTLTSCLFRIVLRILLRSMRAKGYNIKHVLLVGWNDISEEFYQRVMQNKRLGYEISGYFDSREDSVPAPNTPYLGNLDQLGPYLEQRHAVDEVVIALGYSEMPLLEGMIELCEKEGVKASLLPFYTKYLPARPYIDEVEGLPLINIRKIPLDNFLSAFCKRAFDLLVSLCVLIVFSPLLLFTAAGVKLSSHGPVFYKQERIGRNKKPFTMYKFRSMRVDGDGSDLTTWGTKSDNRRTKFGTLIRKLSIDELPQLYNVLRGDMSLVGPRPERPFFVDKFREEIPLYMVKHFVRPGITGWAQVNGWRGDTSITERIKCDIYYIENWSFLFDIKILFLTVFKGGIINGSEKL